MAEHIPPDRFAEYVDEIHEFSGTHRVPRGKPEDLAQLLEALRSSELFATDFYSLIRSVVLREQCQVSESQLLTLVVVAWGGENADDSMDQLPSLVQKLRTILRGVPKGGASSLMALPTDDSEVTPELSSNFNDTIREIEEISPDVQLYRQLLKIQDKREERSGAEQDSVSIQRGASAQDGQSGPSDSLDGTASARRLEPSWAEILALGLTGLVVSLLFSVGSLPVYRARVSVYLPSSFAGATNPLAGNRGLTERVAERLLPLPHQNPILRQDALSRGMRDLHLGGNEPILYADLVAETAHQVKVRQLPSNNLYEITCDSWSSRFATIFCNELIEELDEQMGGALSSPRGTESGHIVDSAIDRGIQVYPHWYLQSLAGLIIGCMVGVSAGFIKRPAAQDVQEKEDGWP